MTAQFEDTIIYNQERYSITAETDSIDFDPWEYGLEPESICTACWSGYWCEYKITDSELYLHKLYIHNKGNEYPKLNGKRVKMFPRFMRSLFHRVYKPKIHMQYTGKILLGKDFIDEYYIHMGFQRPYSYRTLIELVFSEGRLIECIDHSQAAERIRESIDTSKRNWEMGDDSTVKFVSEAFSRDYKTKAWWLDEEQWVKEIEKEKTRDLTRKQVPQETLLNDWDPFKYDCRV